MTESKPIIESFGQTEFDGIIPVWEASVRASHDFITEQEIIMYRRLIRDVYLAQMRLFGIRQRERIAAFAAVRADKLEMLFVHPEFFGRGYGKRLVGHAVTRCSVTRVDVNEQNPTALAFYLHLGFRVAGRDNEDARGAPHPILHLEIGASGVLGTR